MSSRSYRSTLLPWRYVGQQDATELPASSHADRAKCERTNRKECALLRCCQARRNTLDFAIQVSRRLPLLNECDAVTEPLLLVLVFATDWSAHLRLGRHAMS